MNVAMSAYAKCLILLLATWIVGLTACAPPTASSLPSTQTDAAKIDASSAKSNRANEGKLLDEAWEAMYMQGGKVGYGRTTRRKIDSPEGTRFRTSAEQTIVLKRYGQTTEQTISYSSDETEDGKLLSLRADLSAGTMSLQSHGEVKNGLLQLTTITQGKRSTESIPWDDDLLGYFGLEDSLRRQPMQAGEKRRVKWLQPLIHQISDEHLEAVGEEEVDLLGEKQKLLKIKSTASLAGQTIDSLIWVDAEGRAWRSSRPALGQETYRTTKEVATAKSEATFDLGLDTVVKITPPLEKPHETRRVVYRAKLKHGNPATVFPSCGSQIVKEIDQHTAELTVQRVTATEPEKVDAPCPAPTDGDGKSNNLIQSEDPTVREMAKGIAPGEQDPAKLAIALESYVHEKVTNKNFSQAFSTAADVAKTLEGDCTEHAVLLAALCRARDIPARVAAGLVYYEPQQGFAYHMWTEVWLADRWVPLDATLGRGSIGGAHLKLFDSNLDGIGAFGAFLPVMNVLGQLELEVIKAE